MTDHSCTSDRAQMRALRGGDRRALGTLYDRHAPALHTFLVRWTGDPAAAEDLMHETFLRLLAPTLSYDGWGRFRTWLFRIARNLATDRFRRAARWTELDEAPEPVSDAPTPLEDLEALEELARLTGLGGAAAVTALNGEVRAGFRRTSPEAPITLLSRNGGLELTLPNDPSGRFVVETRSGAIRSPLPLAVEELPGDVRSDQYRPRRARLTTTTPGPDVRLMTLDGDIDIRAGG